MALSLSTSAAPELALGAFDGACRARGLEGVELHFTPRDDLDALVDEVEASGARVVALRVESFDDVAGSLLARASARLGVPLSVPVEAVPSRELAALAAEFVRAGGCLLIGEGTRLDAMIELAARVRALDAGASLGIAWEVRPTRESLDDASAVLFAVRDLLGLVRLHGGGPEQRDQEGLGVGGLLADLALSKYTGPTVLCPSTVENVPRWGTWLASKKIVGCGTKAEARTLALDVREVEPRDRLETILGAYDSLRRGATMQLTVDHDPSCMYYTLQAKEAEGSFSFRVLESGPEVWRAEVTKL